MLHGATDHVNDAFNFVCRGVDQSYEFDPTDTTASVLESGE